MEETAQVDHRLVLTAHESDRNSNQVIALIYQRLLDPFPEQPLANLVLASCQLNLKGAVQTQEATP